MEYGLDDLKDQILKFKKQFNRMPKSYDFNNKNGLLEYHKAASIARENGMKLSQVCADIDCFNCSVPSVKYYDEYKAQYVKLIIESGKQPNIYAIWHDNNYLPRPDWMIKNCPDKSVKTTRDWYCWVGINNPYISKEDATKIIYKMAKDKGSPLIYDDFRGRGLYIVSISTIRKYWNTINEMKRDLGLDITQDRMDTRHKSIDEIIECVNSICEEVYKKEHRTTITGSDFDCREYSLNAGTLNTQIHKNLGYTLSEYVRSLGYEYVKSGQGLSYDFDDGEHSSSRFEYIFSNYLRSAGLIYSKDYSRDVKYKMFVDDYTGNMDCDYRINYNGRTIFIEIAGVLREFKTWYLDNRKITNHPSKEKYRLKLLEKEKLLKKSGYEYFILFPCDLTREFFDAILKSDYIDTKKRLNNHYKNNIEWGIIDNNVGVVFDYSKIGRDGQPSVVYS